MLAYIQYPYVAKREKMVKTQIIARGIDHVPTLNAMRAVPRHLFVSEYYRDMAYSDSPLPIGYGQTISQPYIVAFMTAILELDEKDKVLEIGTGSGYQAAVLAELVDSVFTIEIIRELAVSAEKRLRQLNYKNIRVRHGDGYQGWKTHAPYDAIMVTAGAESIPEPLVKQLKEGGRMIIPVGPVDDIQYLVLVTKKGGTFTQKKMIPVRFVPFVRD